MGVTVEIDGLSARVVDTTKGTTDQVILKSSIQVTLSTRKVVTILDGTSNQAIGFDSITAAKVLVCKADGAVTIKVNGSATGEPFDGVYVQTSTGGLITSATLSNASGATRTIEVLLAG